MSTAIQTAGTAPVRFTARRSPLGVAPCSRPVLMDTRRLPHSSQSSLWRPWISTSPGGAGCQRNKQACPYSRVKLPGSLSSDGKPQPFQHPVRLFWPRSKSFDYLYSDGEALLRNFPIQATISFYEESDSEDDEDEEDEEGDWEEESNGDSMECFKPKCHFSSHN